MPNIRTAHSQEIPSLITTSDTHRDNSTAEYLAGLLNKGCTRPEWCFVAEEDGRLIGSIVLWTFPGNDTPLDFVLFESPWSSMDLSIANALIDHAGEVARTAGAKTQGHVVDLPAQAPQFQQHPEMREKCLQGKGFALSRNALRYRWTADQEIPEEDGRLIWKSLAEIGDEPFLDLLEELLTDTRDSLLQAEVKELGLRKAAESLWEESLEFEHEPHWYEIAYDGDGTAAAVSLPGKNPAYPVIGFVGVSPRHRGKGYATSAVVRGTRILAEAGATEIRGDCDADNPGMVKGFERATYQNFAERREYRRVL